MNSSYKYIRNYIFIFLIGMMGLTTTSYAESSKPQECLEQISQSIEDADLNTFESLVDIDAILDSAFDIFLKEVQKPENASQIPPMVALLLSQAASSDKGKAIKGLVLSEARAFVTNGIQSGAFAGKKIENGQSAGLLAPFFANASIGRKEIRGIGEAVPYDDGWLLPFSVHDYGNDQDYAIIGHFTPAENGLRLSSIENIDQIFQQIQRENM